MKSAILAIGDELTCGYRLDTNSQAISRHLTTLPTEVTLHLTVGDDMAAIQHALRVPLDVADILIITGGLGPTEDDLTRQAVAAYFGIGGRRRGAGPHPGALCSSAAADAGE